MPIDTLKELHSSFTTKKTALKAILDLGHDMTQEKFLEAAALKTECDGLQGRITEIATQNTQSDAMKAALEGYDSFLNDPVRNIPFAGGAQGGDGASQNGHFGTLGSVDAGGAYFETIKGVKTLVYEDGPGIYTEKTWKAVINPEYKFSLRQFLRCGGDQRKMSAKAMKVLEEGLDDQGGYTVPVDSMINRVIERKPTPTRIRSMVESVNTSREFTEMLKLNYKTDNIYTTGFRVTKTGENPALVSSAQVTDTNLFGTVKIPVHTFMIRALLTKNQIEDSALNLEDFLARKFSETIDILYDDKILNGLGRMEPYGIATNYAAAAAGSGLDDPLISFIKSGDANTITADAIINMAMDLPEQYEDDCRFVFNKTSTFKALRILKDLNDRYLFGAGVQDSGLATPYRPTDLVGYPYVFSGLMPNTAANNYPIIFGDLKGYQFVNRIGFSIQVLREQYAELNQVSILGRVRFGGQVTEPWRMRLLKIAA